MAAAYLGMNATKFHNRLYEHKVLVFFNIDESNAFQTVSKAQCLYLNSLSLY